jgi:hypothetical protein
MLIIVLAILEMTARLERSYGSVETKGARPLGAKA